MADVCQNFYGLNFDQSEGRKYFVKGMPKPFSLIRDKKAKIKKEFAIDER